TIEPLSGLVGNMQGDAATLTFLRQGLKKLSRSFVIQGTFQRPIFRFM
ncbi:MAG: Type secretion system protein GspN, partial [Thermodesulfobacteriota bacterium]|nr:Type secretion system protein GspN [Thermodesulfobacteriota bacterium]